MNTYPPFNRTRAPRLAVAAGLFLAPVFFALAQTSANPPPDVTAALQELSQRTGQRITTSDQAKALCDQEKFFSDCGAVGKTHNLYKQDRIIQVDAVLEGLKGKIADELKNCADAACIADVAGRVAQSVSAAHPDVARSLDLTQTKVNEKKAIIAAAQDSGVDINQCRAIDPDTAPVELLRGCARLAKDKRVQGSLSADARQSAAASDGATALREALASNQYQCGDNTVNGCGNFCLSPTGANAQDIPQICRDIAQKFFGADGVKHLEEAHSNTAKAKEFYATRAANAAFTTADGRTLIDPAQIGDYMQGQMQSGNVDAVSKGLDFMVTQGFVKPEEKDFALKMAQKIKDQGGNVNFDQCSQDPARCKNLIPDDQRQELDASTQVHQILQDAMGIDPRECQNSGADPSVGQKCSAGAKQALPQLEALAKNSPQAQAVVARIKTNLAQSEDFQQKKSDIEKQFQQGGGPGSCRSETQCRSYCSDAAHGAECIAFGAKNQISGFKGQEAVQRFQQFNQTLQNGQSSPGTGGAPGLGFSSENQQFQNQNQSGQQGTQGQFPGRGPFPGFQPPGQDGTPPDQLQRSHNGPGGFGSGGNRGSGNGPSPECFAAIQSGDFVTAKTACASSMPGRNAPSPSQEQPSPSSKEPGAPSNFHNPSPNQFQPPQQQNNQRPPFRSGGNYPDRFRPRQNNQSGSPEDNSVQTQGGAPALPPQGSDGSSPPRGTNMQFPSNGDMRSPNGQFPSSGNINSPTDSMPSMPSEGSFPPPSSSFGSQTPPPPPSGPFQPPSGFTAPPTGAFQPPPSGSSQPPPPSGTAIPPPSGGSMPPPPSGASTPPPPPHALNFSENNFGGMIDGIRSFFNSGH